MKRPNMNVDRISGLPESIVHHIMSYLPKRQVARTRILSKRWNRMHRSYPVLNLSLGWKYRAEARNLIYKSLHHFSQEKLPLEAFNLDLNAKLSSDLDAWLKLALKNEVKEIKLQFIYGPEDNWYWDLPQVFSSCESLRVLKLYQFELNMPFSTFRFLRELHLSSCNLKRTLYLKNDDWPHFEVLVLRNCFGVYGSLLSNLPQLHTVKLFFMIDDDYYAHMYDEAEENTGSDDEAEEDTGSDDEAEEDTGSDEEAVVATRSLYDDKDKRFIIEGESIQCLTIFANDSKPWSVINIDGCSSLKSLQLHSEKITDAEFHSLLLNLPLLEELFLSTCNALETIQIFSSRIKTLGLHVGNGSRLVCVEIKALNLKNFIFTAYQKECEIKIADCCCNLTTLILHWRVMTETVFHGLVSKFPLLENLWIVKCHELERIQVRNSQLKRLHIVKCRKYKDVDYKFGNPNSGEFYFKEYEEQTVRLEYGRTIDFPVNNWWIRLDKFLQSVVGLRDDSVIDTIHRSLWL